MKTDGLLIVHPLKDQLIAFGQGKLAADESSSVEQHLEVCRECCETLLDLKDDTFVGLVKIAQPSDSDRRTDTLVRPATESGKTESDKTGTGKSAHPTEGGIANDSAHSATMLVQSGEAVSVDDLPAELQDHPRYRIVELIGRGGMGNVYRAEHRLMNRPVALKLINSQLIRQPQAVERFRREVQAAAKLTHPNIVTAYDAEQAGDVHFLVMEFVEGTDLASVVKHRGPMSVTEACECIRQVAEGLQHAHEKGMVHRDIKPHNLMLSAEGQVRILDFGLAGFVTESVVVDAASVQTSQDADAGSVGHGHLTMAGSVMGTPDYIAPEQAKDAHSADIRADIYSLGCTLHFLLTGKPPFVSDNIIAKLKAHAERMPEPLTKLRGDVPQELSNVVARMMAKKPAERFQTPAAVAEALAPFAKPAASPPRRRVRTMVAALCMGVAALLAGVIFVQTSKGRVEIRSEVDDVEIVIKQGGEQIDFLDTKTGSQVKWLPSGEYEIKLKGDRNDIEIKGGNFTLSRWGTSIVTLKRKPEGLAADQPHKSNVDAQKPASHKLSAGWGDFINTDGASDVRESDGRVTITVPPGDRTYWSQQGPGSVPRLMQEVDGDFVAQVKVTLERDSDKSHLFSASLAVWNHDRDFHTLTFTLYASNDSLSAMRFLDGPRGVTSSGTSGKSRIAHLKIERRNNELTTSWSRDGETWEKTKEPVIVNWPRKVQVGVAVNNRSTDELRVQFEELTITKDAPPPAIAPFDAEQAKAHQAAWAKHLGVPVEYTNSLGMKFRLIPPGEFTMGSPSEEIDRLLTEAHDWQRTSLESERPQRQVRIPGPFFMGQFEVTVGQFKLFIAETGHKTTAETNGTGGFVFEGDKTDSKPDFTWRRAADAPSDNHPVVQISLPDAQAFCAWLSKKEGRTYAVPQEEQWEYACRAGTTSRWYCGDVEEPVREIAWISPHAGYPTHAVGGKQPNAFGLFDMLGNAEEFCVARGGAVSRGGHIGHLEKGVRSATRNYLGDYPTWYLRGFRVSIVGDLKGQSPPPAIAPFDAEKAKKHQEAWAKHLGVPVEYTNSIGMKFRLIPPGEFTMGSPPEEIEVGLVYAGDNDFAQRCAKSEGPQHKVILSQPRYVGIYEVTQAQYEKVMGKNPSHFAATGSGKDVVIGLNTTNHPVEFVSWHEAVAFCAKLSQQEKLQRDNSRRGDGETQLNGVGYRLLTEAEWEFSCRAGSTTKYSSGDGDEQLDQIAWIGRNSPNRTHAVGELQPNSFGIHDIHGNVWEWCQDPWELTYYGRFQEQPALDPNGPQPNDAAVRVMRGGAFGWPAFFCRASNRHTLGAEVRLNQIGFRVSLDIEAVRQASQKSAKTVQGEAVVDSLGPEELKVLKAAEAFLAVADEGNFDKLYDLGSTLAKKQAKREQVVPLYQQIRDTAGKVEKRTLRRVRLIDEFLGLPPGRYAAVQYASDFEKHKGLWESVLLNVDDDGQWRVNTYAATVQPLPLPEPKKTSEPKASEKSQRPAAPTQPATVPPGANLITDPSFENTGLTQLPRDWRAWANEDSDFRCEVVNGGHTGQRSLRVSGKGIRGVVFGNDLKADRTKRYALKGWAKFEGDKDARAVIKFNYFRGSEFLGVHDLIGVTADQPGWHLFEKTDTLDAYPQADHFYAMCHVEGSGTGWFDDLELVAYDRDKLPNDFDVRHGRHNRLTGPNSLHRWVGTWDTEYAFRETDNSPQETKLSMTTTSERTLGDYFLMSHSKAKPPAGDERLQFLLFDQNLGAFRQWIFSSNGKVFEWRGPWNNEKQTLELRMLPDASNLHSSEHFVDDDHIEAKLKFQYVMGQRDAGRWTATRKAVDGKVDVPIAKTHVAEPELSQLNKFAGEWTIRARYKPSVWNPQPREETIREASSWILGGRFLMTRALNEKDELTSIWIATYEPMEKSNRFWFFNADGSSGEWRLTWDEASRGFHFRGIDMPTGWVGTGFNRWINDDTFDNQALIKDENGRVLLDSTQDKRRKK